MIQDLGGKVVVITGASSGIGEATALEFARQGAKLVLAARDLEAVQAVADRCVAAGADAIAIQADVTDTGSITELADHALTFGGAIDIWFSNVGVGAVGLFHETPMAAHEHVVRTNLVGHMNDAHAVVPIFLRQGRGTFVNMISLGGFAATPWAAAYSASKFGLKGFSEALRAELTPYPDIHVCDVYPAFVDTPGLGHGANYTGKSVSAPPPVMNARRVATAVVELARRPRPGVTLGAPAVGLHLLHGIAPKTTAAAMGWFMRNWFRRAEAAPVTDGNLFAPPSGPGGVAGGLSRVNRKAAVMIGSGAAAVAAILLGLHHLRRTRRT